MQQERHRGLKIKKIAGELNVADLATKDHPERRFLELRAMARMVDCSNIDEYIEHEANAIEAVFGSAGGSAPASADSATQAWGGALRLLTAALALARGEAATTAMEIMKIDEDFGDKCKMDELNSDSVASIVTPILILSLMLGIIVILVGIILLQWRLMVAWGREAVVKKELRKCEKELDKAILLQCVAQRSKASQSQTTYRWDYLTPRFQPLPEHQQG